MPALRALLTTLIVATSAIEGTVALPAEPSAPPARAAADDVTTDEVELKTGKVLAGRVVYEDGTVVILRVGTSDREIARDEVEAVRSRQRALNDLLDNLDGVNAADEVAVHELADRARATGLPDEARLLDLWVVCHSPDDPPANQALGNRQDSKGWRHHHGSSWLPVSDIYKLQGEWKQRWTLRTTHYEVQTDIALTAAIGCAFDLERLHRAFLQLFAGQVRVLDVDETMQVQIHADGSSYPEPGDRRLGYFDRDALTLFVLAQGPYTQVLVHEATHQLLHFTTQRTRGARGEIPGWFNEGLAQYFESGLEKAPIGLRLLVGRPNGILFRMHASSTDPYELKRLLTMEPGDFAASSNSALKYAQAYSLVYFLLHGARGNSPQPAFWNFADHAWKGQSSMSDFRKAIDGTLDDFENNWTIYVREMAAGN